MKLKIIIALCITAIVFLLSSILHPVVDIETVKIAAAQFKDTENATLMSIYTGKASLFLDLACFALWAFSMFIIFKNSFKDYK